MIVPGVNLMMYGVYGFNVARAFNKPSNSELLYASLMPYLFFVSAGLDPKAKFVNVIPFIGWTANSATNFTNFHESIRVLFVPFVAK